MQNPINALKYMYGSGEITPELNYTRKYGIIPPANIEIGVDENEWVVAYTSHSGKLYVIRQLDPNNFQIIYPVNSSVAGGIEDAVKKWENVNWEKVKVAISKIKAVCSIFGDVYMLLVARYLAGWESLEQAHNMALRKTRACEEPYGAYTGELPQNAQKEIINSLHLPIKDGEDFIIYYAYGDYFILRMVNHNTLEFIYKVRYSELSEEIRKMAKE